MIRSVMAVWKEKKLSFFLALIPWLASFLLEGQFFVVARSAHLLTYVGCKGILLVGLFLFADFLLRAIREPKGDSRYTLLYAMSYFLILLGWMLWKLPLYLQGDELNIYTQAKQLDPMAYWFNYFTGCYWISCGMLLPFELGPILIKLLLHSLTMGYCAQRLRKHSSALWALLLYIPYLQPFVLDLGASAHRLPLYGILYLFLAAKLFFDHKEQKKLDGKTLLLLSVVLGILSYWRTEGIYMVVAGAILIPVAYRLPVRKQLSRLWKPAVCYVLILLILALPQFAAYADDSKPSMMVRSAPLCGYALANMLRSGLEEADIEPATYEAIDVYIPFEKLREMNAARGDAAYSHAMAMDLADPKADFAVRGAFCDAVKGLILKHPLIFLRSQWNGFCYTSAQYSYEGDLQTFLRYGSYRQWLPLLLCGIFLIFGLLRKRFVTMLLSLCGLGNWALVTALMPAAYAKYFYVDYLLGYFLLFLGLACLLSRRKEQIYE